MTARFANQQGSDARVWSEAARLLVRSEPGQALTRVLAERGKANQACLPDPATSFLIASLTGHSGRPDLVLVPDEARARTMREELVAFLEPGEVLTFHGRELSLYDARAVSRQLELERTSILTRLGSGRFRVLIVPADAALQRLRSPRTFFSFAVPLETGMTIEPETLEARLVQAGYERVPQVEGPGQYARRGDIVDIWAPSPPDLAPEAVRVSFFDIEIDQLRSLDPDSQRSIEVIETFTVPPAREFPLTAAEREETARQVRIIVEKESVSAARAGLRPQAVERLKESGNRDLERLEEGLFFPSLDRWIPLIESENSTVLDYADADKSLLFLDEPLSFSRRMDAAHAGFALRVAGYIERGETFSLVEDCQISPPDLFRVVDSRQGVLALVDLPQSGNGLPGATEITWRARPSDRFQNRPERLVDQLKGLEKKKGATLLYAGSDDRAVRLSLFLAEEDLLSAAVIPASLPRGFVFPDQSILVAGTGDLFGVSRKKRRTKKRPGRELFFKDLTPGALVVHEDYGVGEYQGIETIATSDGERDYLTVTYRDGLLHLPVDRVELLTPYVQAGEVKPKLSKLGGTEWQRQKERARTSIKRLVTDITALYAERQQIKGHVYAPDTPWQQEFESTFPFEETEDQLRVIAEIKEDMESDKVMDRLVCGDVGFGKTEVCFRALFKCVMEGKQGALLAPTTVLVSQHYNNLVERLEGFPVKVRQLSRFASAREQKETIDRLARGDVDIVIGTHRLLSKDIAFRDLGLLVIDEEQRFGVDHKEMIKALSPAVEVLSLSATPIPRTLHLSLSGIRDISLLEEGPEDRLPVHTSVIEYSEDLIIDAILREQARHGQVFYLFNNTHRINGRTAELEARLPGVRFGIAHGRMPEGQLEKVISSFIRGEFDVLVCTTIIESGIDMPHVNTLIVEDADRFGLSQLYQLRGRVGRSERQAYALITYRPDRIIGEAAQKRLAAIRDFTELGSGFQIALRDLEVRGAGSLLGAEQSGHLEAIGYDLYTKMLEEAVIEQRDGPLPEKKPATVVDLPTDAILPDNYVHESGERLDLYRRIASIRNIDDYRDVLDELFDRYGQPPSEAVSLLDIAYIRAYGERVGFSRVRARGTDIELLLSEDASASMDLIADLLASDDQGYPLIFKAGYRPLILVSGAFRKPRQATAILRELFSGSEPLS
ncbi:MAG: transcription-repair coupling factor [Clostridiaceae bacterium]|nr:transcription-repair coupling factor [Clostridiaceae bacterium]